MHTGNPCFTLLLFITHCRYCLFYKLKVCGNFMSRKSIGTVFPTAFVFLSLCHILVILTVFQTFSFFFYFFLNLILFFKLYIIVLVLPNIKMNLPQVYMCSPSCTLLPPPSPFHPSGSSQCTSPKHPVSCIEPGLATRFIHDILHVSNLFFITILFVMVICVQ